VKKTEQTPLEKLLANRVPDPAGIVQDLDELFRLVHAPGHLAGGLKVARNLRRILRAAAADEPSQDARARLHRYLRALRWLLYKADKLKDELYSCDDDRELFLRTIDKNPMLHRRDDGAEVHGLWTLLWEHHPDRVLLPAFRSLQQHAALSHMELMRYWKRRPEWYPGSSQVSTLLNTLYCETLAIRHFVMPDYLAKAEYVGTLTELSARISKVAGKISVSDLISALEQAAVSYVPKSDAEPTSIYKDLCAIVWLLKRQSTPEKLRQPKRTIVIRPPGPINEYELENSPVDDLEEESQAGASGEDGEVGTSEDEDEDQDSDVVEAPQLYRRHRWPLSQIEECLSSGTHPADELPSSSIFLSHRKSGPRIGGSWAAMKNRLFHWSTDEVPPELLAEGMDILQTAANRGGLAELELYARASIILRLGATGSAMREMVVCADHPQEPKSLTLVLPKLGTGKHSEWIVPALPLGLKAKLAPFPGCRRVDDHFVLPDYTAAGTMMRRLLRLQTGSAWGGKPVKPFGRTSTDYDQQLRDCFCRETPARAQVLQSVFTFPRLGEVRFRQIYDHAQENVVPATYLTRREHRTGEVTRFYETLKIRLLQRLDKLSLAGMWKDLDGLGFKSGINLTLVPSRSDGYVGSPFCPTAKALSDFLVKLREEFEAVSDRLERDVHLSDLVRFHNLYVTYTYVGYNLAAGHRAVIGGYSDPKQVDQRSPLMLMGIMDKGLRGRLIPASTIAYAQMRACAEYLDGIDRFLYIEKPSVPLYFVDDDRTVLEISPFSLRKHLPFVANFGRHYVCTSLVERMLNGDDRITIEYLKEFLGHATEGEDRTASDSAFDYPTYALSMRAVVDDLLEEIGYWPIDISGHQLPPYEPDLECFLATGATWPDKT
jgi:hypothetical protein